MSYVVPNIPRSGLGLAHDTRSYLESLRRREIWQKFETAKANGVHVEYNYQMPKSELIRIAVKRNIDLESTPKADGPIIGPELSIHELRKQVMALTAYAEKKGEVMRMTKDQMKEILSGDNPPASG